MQVACGNKYILGAITYFAPVSVVYMQHQQTYFLEKLSKSPIRSAILNPLRSAYG